jgi:hypothetical protein
LERAVSSTAIPISPLLASGALLAGAIILWADSLASIDVRRATDVGLISALPVSFFAALLLLTISFALALATRMNFPLLLLQLGVLVLILFGTPSFVEYGPRTQSAWRLAGIADYATQHHSIDRGIDAFFNWPGFFILVSFVTQAAGLSSPLELARWAPLFFNLAYAIPLLVIFRALALSRRQIWIGLWLFFACNWTGQDYLAPQAFTYFVYLSIIAIIVAVFPGKPGETDLDSSRKARSPSARASAAAVALLLLLYALIVPSHQLSPWLVVISVAGLVLVGRLPSRGLPVVMVVMAAAWVTFGAVPFLQGHFATVAGPLGSVGSNVNENLGSRFAGNQGHLFVVWIRSGLSVAIGALAVYGALRLRRSGAWPRTIIVLALAPFLALGLQSYGGELLLRTYFFSLPFLSLAAAAALAPAHAGGGVARRAAGTAILLLVSIVFLVTRYGNERMDAFTKQEVAAVKFLFATAPAGARVVSANYNIPWQYQHYADYDYYDLPDSTVTDGSINDVVHAMSTNPRSSYLLLTRSQAALGELFAGWPSSTMSKFRSDLIRSGRFRIIFQNEDSTLFKLRVRPLSPRKP